MTIIDTEKALELAVKKAFEAGAVAIDTEFVWERTYYPKLGLVQMGYPDGTSDLIDTLAISDFSSLGRLLEDLEVTKILHDAIQDLVILTRITGYFPKTIFDTQRAAGFVGLSSTISLSDLLKECLSIHLNKTETQSNWLARPLSENQIRYAEEDVCHGVALMKALLEKAERLKHRDWLLEEMNLYNDEAQYREHAPEAMSPKVKKSGALSYPQKSLLRALFVWREGMARKQNLPRTFILSDENLLRLVKSPPKSYSELKQKDLGRRFLSKFSKTLWQAFEFAQSDPLPALKSHNFRYEKKEALEAQVDLALAFIKGLSLASGIDPSLISNRAGITQFVYAVSENEQFLAEQSLFQGWRKAFCGKDLSQLLKGRGSIRVDAQKQMPVYSP